MNSTNKMNKICKGCLVNEKYISKPDKTRRCIGYLKEDIDCPCSTCLIKMMCDSVCDKLKSKSWWYKPGEDPNECE